MVCLCKVTFGVGVTGTASTAFTTVIIIVVISLLEVSRTPSVFCPVSLFNAKHVLFLGLFHHRVGQTEKFDVVTTNINFLQLVELLAVVVVENYVCESEIHP